MIREVRLRVLPFQAADTEKIKQAVARETGDAAERILGMRILKKSIDARQRQVVVNLTVQAFVDELPAEPEFPTVSYGDVSGGKPVVVVGAGPAGLFAALRLIELGMKPIVVERGKNVRDRKRDIARISREQKVDPESNYSFGEGGAGAFSDGKLYTRSKKRGSVEKILQVFCQHGASTNILYDAVNNRASHNTIIQMLYQFGIIGTIILITWIVSLSRYFKNKMQKNSLVYIGLLLTAFVGFYSSWVALDMLYFDDFFYFSNGIEGPKTWYYVEEKACLGCVSKDLSFQRDIIDQGNVEAILEVGCKTDGLFLYLNEIVLEFYSAHDKNTLISSSTISVNEDRMTLKSTYKVSIPKGTRLIVAYMKNEYASDAESYWGIFWDFDLYMELYAPGKEVIPPYANKR